MKQKIDRITTGAKSISLRTLAMVLCFVMLLSAIGIGTVVTAIAKSSNAKAAAAGALSRAVADVADEEEDEDEIVRGMKSDLAGTGDAWSWGTMTNAKVYGSLHTRGSGFGYYDGSWQAYTMSVENSNHAYWSIVLPSDTDYYFQPQVEQGYDNWHTYGPTTGNYDLSNGNYDLGNGSNDSNSFKIHTISSDSGYVNVSFDYYQNHANVKVSQSAYTNLYAYGQPNHDGWDATNNKSYLTKSTTGANSGCYYFDIVNRANSYFQLTIGKHSYGATEGNAPIPDSKPASGNMWKDNTSNSFAISATGKTYRIWIDASGPITSADDSNGTVKVWYEDVTPTSDYYFVDSGTGPRGWDIQNDHGFTANGDGTYSYTTTLTENYEFFIKKSDGTSYRMTAEGGTYYINDADVGGNALTMVTADSGKNLSWHASSYYTSEITIKFDPSGPSVQFIDPNAVDGIYLTGWLNGSGVTSPQNQFAFTETVPGSGVYTLEYTFTAGTAQYVTVSNFVVGDETTAYHPRSHNATSGTPYATHDAAPNDDPKWKVNAGTDRTVKFTWDTARTGNAVLSWQIIANASDRAAGGSSAIDFDTTGYSDVPDTVKIKYKADTGGSSFSGTLDTAGTSTFMQNGSKYWVVLNETTLNAWKTGTNNQQIRWNIYPNNNDDRGLGDKNGTSVDTTTYATGITSKMENNGDIVFVELSALSNDISSLGIFIDTSNKKVVYYTANTTTGGSDDIVAGQPMVTIYAKDGAVLGSGGKTYANIADTKIYEADGATAAGTSINGSVSGQTYETLKATAGTTVVIKTTINENFDEANPTGGNDSVSLREKYYVRGFCVNGETYYGNGDRMNSVLNNDGVYTLTYTVPEDITGESVEITPIYYIDNTSGNYDYVTYRVLGFTEDIQGQGWGNTLYAYPYYGKLHGHNNSFGAYPGQPLVCVNGQYTIQIPLKSTAWTYNSNNNADAGNAADLEAVHEIAVSGVTMSNGYYDAVHKQLQGFGSNNSSTDHLQTYDYDDFYKIYNEKNSAGDKVDNIVFQFKHETVNNNREDVEGHASYTKAQLESTFTNGFEPLLNYHGKKVDLFGNILNDTQEAAAPVYVVSKAGPNGSSGVVNIAGYYATEWYVYAPPAEVTTAAAVTDSTTFTQIKDSSNRASLPPSILVLNNDDDTSFNATTYPSASDGHTITDYKALYTELKTNYLHRPVMITYEKIKAQEGSESYEAGSGGATRNDGRWLYSRSGEKITANVRVDVSQNSGRNYYPNGDESLDYTDETEPISGLEAYFTNTEVYGETTFSTLIDEDETFDLEASTSNANYKFVGWYMEDGTKITNLNSTSTERSGSHTFVARFMKVTSGQLIISHGVATGTVSGTDYTGSGTAKIAVNIFSGNDNTTDPPVRTYAERTSDITIDETYIGSDKEYTIQVILTAEEDTNTTYGTTVLTQPSDGSATFFDIDTPSTVGKVTTTTFNFNVSDLYDVSTTNQTTKALIYKSYFTQYLFNYNFRFQFTDRSGANKQYIRHGTLTNAQAETYIVVDGETRTLKKEFIQTLAPYESNFGEKITWNLDNVAVTGSGTPFTIQQTFTAVQNSENKVNVTFDLPYMHTDGVAVVDANGVGTATDSSNNLEFVKAGEVDKRVVFGKIPSLSGAWVTAPTKISGDNQYFQYWSIKTTKDNTEVARCYYPGFNFAACDNYLITAVYGQTEVDYTATGRNTYVTYLSTTRNQWNAASGATTDENHYTENSGKKTVNATHREAAADLLYNDFMLNYTYDGKYIFKGEADEDIAELGMIVQRIRVMDLKEDGSYITDVAHYADTANVTDAEFAEVVAGTSANQKFFTKHVIATNQLDNKNRIEFYDAFYNSGGWDADAQAPVAFYAYKNYVYRAYSYMKLNDGTIIKSAPAYFTMNDEALK